MQIKRPGTPVNFANLYFSTINNINTLKPMNLNTKKKEIQKI